MKEAVCLSSAYLAPIQYYSKLYIYNKVYMEQYDNYVKQTYRNRCVIAVSDGPLALTIPTEKPKSLKCPMKDIRISDHGNWRHVHWNALVAGYNNSPFFEYYEEDFHKIYAKHHHFLWDFNWELCSLVCSLIDIQPNIQPTTCFEKELPSNVADYRELIHPKKDYLVEDPSFSLSPYYQVFKDKHGFLPNLSIVDLLFNMGPESLLLL